MNEENEFNETLLEEVRQLITIKKIDPQEVIKQLIANKVSERDATRLVLTIMYEYKNELFQTIQKEESVLHKIAKNELFEKLVKAEKEKQHEHMAIFVIVFFAIIGPIFNTDSALWYLMALLGAGLAGYFGFSKKQAAGVAGGVLLVFLFPFTYNYYFSGRSRYLNIEILIPLLFAAVPAFLIFFLISRIFYNNTEE